MLNMRQTRTTLPIRKTGQSMNLERRHAPGSQNVTTESATEPLVQQSRT
jgi:hypothetical protein